MASKDKSAVTRPSDVDIMMYLDGELEGADAKAVVAFLESDEDAKTKATSLGQLSELLQGSMELEADEAADKLAGLWSGIDKAIHSKGLGRNGVASEAHLESVAEVKSEAAKAEARATDALVKKANQSWLGGWQSHLMTGAFVAVAVAVLMIATRPDATKPEGPTAVRQVTPAAVVSVALASQDPEVEDLEVYDGSGVVMTIPGDAEGAEGASTVIWISNDTDVVEDPI